MAAAAERVGARSYTAAMTRVPTPIARALAPLLLTLATLAQAAPSPGEALDEFLRLELNGGRLEAAPAPSRVTVVETYKLGRVQCDSVSHCRAPVRFVLAPLQGAAGAADHPGGGSEDVSYDIERGDDGWRVTPDGSAPRIYFSVYRKRVAPGAVPASAAH